MNRIITVPNGRGGWMDNPNTARLRRAISIGDRYTGNISNTQSFRSARQSYYASGMENNALDTAMNRRYSRATYMGLASAMGSRG